MHGALGLVASSGENLKDIEFTTSRSPARAFSRDILASARNLSIEHPDGGHISVCAGGAGLRGHLELKQEDLLASSPAVVGNGAWTVVVAAGAGSARCVGEDGELSS